MDEIHQLKVLSHDQARLEACSEKFVVEGLLKARAKTIQVLEEIRSALKEGMSEDEGRILALSIFADHGVKKHWHRPYFRFGAGTVHTFHQPLQDHTRFKLNDPYYLDLGPVWPDHELGLEYEGDYGDTFVFGTHPEGEKCIQTCHDLFSEIRHKWKTEQISGHAIYEYMNRRASELGYVCAAGVNGHRIGDFPHHKHSKNSMSDLAFVPSESIWVLEVQLNHPEGKFGAFFEDIL